MNQKTKMRYTSEKGITLIALVITIIVLLILAGVTISMVLGDDGIIAQSQKAKERYEDEAKNEKEKLDETAREMASYKDDTAESLAKKGELKVGDFVIYNYTGAKYTTPEASTGKSVHDDGVTSSFDSTSAGSDYIENTKWRVLSVDNNKIELIPDIYSLPKLTMYGKSAYVNAKTVLNEMCEALYSGDYGTARSINVEDLNKKVGYDGSGYYKNASGYVKVEKGTTIGDIETDTLKIGGTRETPDGSDIKDVEIDFYRFGLRHDTQDSNSVPSAPDASHRLQKWGTEASMLLYNENQSPVEYWLADTTNEVTLKENDPTNSVVKYCIRIVSYDKLMRSHIFNTDDGVQTDLKTKSFSVFPIVTLKAGLKLEQDPTNANKWNIVNN